jgi:Caspase domain
MSRQALLIGVDDYPFSPLTSCVNDAVAMRDLLVSLNLFAPNECSLMTSPAVPGSVEVPTRSAILARLLALYELQQPLERLLVFFAGHGLSVRLGREADVLRSVIVPAEVPQLKNVGDRLIDLDEVLGRFARRGATEQYWIVDACRNLPGEGPTPNVSEIGWDRPNLQDPRDAVQMSQAVLYAVAPLGQAGAVKDGRGLVTGHILDGLACRGPARWGAAGWYDEAKDSWLIDLESLADYARRRIEPTLQSWQREYFLPRVWTGEKKPPPLRDAGRMPNRPFGIFIEPPQAASAVAVSLSVKRNNVETWPPRGNGEMVPLAPERYRVEANPTSDIWLKPEVPNPPVVDVREADRLVLTVLPSPLHPIPQQVSEILSVAPDVGRASIASERTEAVFVPDPDSGLKAAWFRNKRFWRAPANGHYIALPPIVTVQAIDPGATVRFTRLTGGKEERAAKPNEAVSLSEGLWRIEILIGSDVIGFHEEDLAAGEHYTIKASAQITPALAALLPNPRLAATQAATDPQPDLVPSEAIGPMQGAILPTLLPMLALKPLDRLGLILRNFAPRLQIPVVDQRSDSPAAVALAFDGAWPDHDVAKLRDGAVVVAGAPTSRVWSDQSQRVSLFLANGERRDNEGKVSVPGWGMIEAVLPRMPHRCTVLSIILWPDGRGDVSIGLFGLPPGEDQVIKPSRLSRALAIATRIYRTRDFVDDVDYDVFRQLSDGSWGDPVLGAVAWFGRARWLAATNTLKPARRNELADRQETISRFLGQHALALSDSRIIAALGAQNPDAALDRLLDDPGLQQPVLADALSALARRSIVRGVMDHWSVARFQRIAPDEVFNVVRSPLPIF